ANLSLVWIPSSSVVWTKSSRVSTASGALVLGRIPIAFLAGFASFVAPCVLPLVPGYLSAVSSLEARRLGERGSVGRVLVRSVPFVLGFTGVFVLLGAGAGALGGAVDRRVFEEIAGFLLVV